MRVQGRYSLGVLIDHLEGMRGIVVMEFSAPFPERKYFMLCVST